MEIAGGEPDVVVPMAIGNDNKVDAYVFMIARQKAVWPESFCYDQEALASRKQPKNSAVAMAESISIEILNEDEIQSTAELGKFDTKTSC